MRTKRGDTFTLWGLYAIFGVQGLLVLIVSLPLQVGAQRPAALEYVKNTSGFFPLPPRREANQTDRGSSR